MHGGEISLGSALIEIDRLGVKRDKKDKYSSVFSLSSFQHYNPPVHNTLILYPNQSTLASMVLCLICWGVYTGVKKAQKTIEQKKWVLHSLWLEVPR